ncbi:MAG: hypothetical protein QNJ68_02775 [Microcoleaceae cyanobacterium MO_207.B10]|nr:hypothetical protein [Microcoleaceae cyanobacterium MO_207.B10]
MALKNSSKSIRVYFDEDDAETRIRFKQLAARADTPMSRRAADLMKLDIAYWEATEEVLDLSDIGDVVDKLTSSGESFPENGHSQHNKQSDDYDADDECPAKILKITADGYITIRFKDGREELYFSDPLGDDFKGEYDGDIFVDVVNPKKENWADQDKVGQLLNVTPEGLATVRFDDGTEKTYHKDELCEQYWRW